ncbi:hypothetical protein ACWNT8_14945 [Pigmentibacter ruber]
MLDIEYLKKQIINLGCTDVEIIEIHAGILVQTLSKNINLSDLKKKILEICLDIHKKLPTGQNAFPYKVFCYEDKNDAFIVDAAFKTRSQENSNTTYLMSEDALITMREIDAEALLYEVQRPFTLYIEEDNTKFSFNPNRRYRALEINGISFELESISIIEKVKNIYKIILN